MVGEVVELRCGSALLPRRLRQHPDNELSLLLSEPSPEVEPGKFVRVLHELAIAWRFIGKSATELVEGDT